MIYAALGDSITYGYSASREEKSFASRIQNVLSRQQPVHVLRQAKPGWTSRQLLKSIQTVPDVVWKEAELVTILIGGNDLLHASPWLLDGNSLRLLKMSERYRENLREIIRCVRGPSSTIIIGTIYNPFPNSVLAQSITETLNQSVHFVASRENVLVADLYRHFNRRESELVEGYRRGSLRDFRFRGNPIHPNDAGHEWIARTFLRIYRKALSRRRIARQKSR